MERHETSEPVLTIGDTLDLSPLEWDDNPNYLNSTIPRMNIDIEFNKLFSEKNKLCSLVSSTESTSLTGITIIKRIGSDSSDGEVYLIKSNVLDIPGEIKELYAVLKVIPIMNNRSENIFNNEMTINRICSGMVRDGESSYFPLMYVAYKCDNIIFPQDNYLYLSSFKYIFLKNVNDNCIEILKKHGKGVELEKESRVIKHALRRIISSINNLQEIKHLVILEYKKFLTKYGIEDSIPIDVKIKGHIIISELASMDLRQYVFLNRNSKEIISNIKWLKIFDNVLHGIKDLQKHNILHNDLHMGNVLMLNKNLQNSDEIDTTWLIHDFGKSIILSEWTVPYRRQDVLKFIEEFESTKCKTSEMAEFVNRLKIKANQIDNNEEYMDILIEYFNAERKTFVGGGFNKKSKKSKKSKRTKKSKRSKTKKSKR